MLWWYVVMWYGSDVVVVSGDVVVMWWCVVMWFGGSVSGMVTVWRWRASMVL